MRLRRRRLLAASLGLAVERPPRAAVAQSRAVDLLLVLAVDASGSVDRVRFELQRQGYVAALRDPKVARAIAGGPNQAIAVRMVQWTGPGMQAAATEWMRLSDTASLLACADAVAAAPRRLFGGGTSISGAIDGAMGLLRAAPFVADRQVIDISGDGANNRGRPAALARDEAVAAGVTINGLPILSLEPELDQHYRDEVIGGPGAFLIATDSYENFAAAILRKLIAEIA